MRRYTTPTQEHTLWGMDLRDCDVYVTYQQDRYVRTWEPDELTVEDPTLIAEALAGSIQWYKSGDDNFITVGSGTEIDSSLFAVGDKIHVRGCENEAYDQLYTITDITYSPGSFFKLEVTAETALSPTVTQDCSQYPVRFYKGSYDADKVPATRITFQMTQEDTGKFNALYGVKAQINWIDDDGVRNASKIKPLNNFKNLLAKVVE